MMNSPLTNESSPGKHEPCHLFLGLYYWRFFSSLFLAFFSLHGLIFTQKAPNSQKYKGNSQHYAIFGQIKGGIFKVVLEGGIFKVVLEFRLNFL